MIEKLVRRCFCRRCDKMQPIPKSDCWYDNCLLQDYEAIAKAARRFVKLEQQEKKAAKWKRFRVSCRSKVKLAGKSIAEKIEIRLKREGELRKMKYNPKISKDFS